MEPAPSLHQETPPGRSPGLLTFRRTAAGLAALFVLGALARLEHVDDLPARTPDEKTYVHHARRVLEGGLRELPALVAEYNQDPGAGFYPTPLRAGWSVLLAGAMRAGGVVDERAGSWLSTLLSVAALGLLGWLGLRFLPGGAALYGLLALALSTADLVVARRCWQDSLVGLLGLVMVWSSCELLRDPRRRWPYALLVATGSYAVLVKELGAVVYLACVLPVLVSLARRRAWGALGAFTVGGLAGAGLSVAALIAVAGGPAPLLAAWRHLQEGILTNPYCATYHGGPWYLTFQGLWRLGPIHLVFTALGVGLSLLPARWLRGEPLALEPGEIATFRLLAWTTAALLATLLLLPNSQNLRFLAAALGPMALLGGVGAWAVVSLARPWLGAGGRGLVAGLVVAAALGGAWEQHQRFERVYVARNIPDLAIKFVLDERW